MNREKLNNILGKHLKWLNDEDKGEKADLNNADLTSANLRNADLMYADLTSANLNNADLMYADLTNADLNNANLTDAQLNNTIGNNKEIKTIQLGTYTINITKDVMQIGCKQYPKYDWFLFTDEEINEMDSNALDWWHKWRELLADIVDNLEF